MGLEIAKQTFDSAEFTEFQHRLALETSVLRELVSGNQLCNEGYSVGLELEGWITDQNHRALPINSVLVKSIHSPQVVSELSAFNWEINGHPTTLDQNFATHLAEDLNQVWELCQAHSKKHAVDMVTIGTLPVLTTDDLGLHTMTQQIRYAALNKQLKALNHGKNFTATIQGKQTLKIDSPNIMPASAGTSLQIHLKTPATHASNYYNVAQLISAPVLAASVNSPILFGKDTWAESRIPLFESILSGQNQWGRAQFGRGYIKSSLVELFESNLEKHPVLLPTVFDTPPEEFSHLKLHGGTVWPWNRPVVDRDTKSGKIHFRIEHRSLPSGPTLLDSITNTVFFLGLAHQLVRKHTHPENLIPFILLEKNYYNAARWGLDAELYWLNGFRLPARTLIRDLLIPAAKKGLQSIDVDPAVITFYLDEVLGTRVINGQTGAQWQRDCLATNNNCFEEMLAQYIEFQNSGLPVGHWPTPKP